MESVDIKSVGCCDCSRREKTPADTVRNLMPGSLQGYWVALCSDCAAISNEWMPLGNTMREWLGRGGKMINVKKSIPANKCVWCFEDGKETDAPSNYEGVPLCKSHHDHLSMQFTYLSGEELMGWPETLALLKKYAREKKITWTDVRFV
jgi:hypothetical protein